MQERVMAPQLVKQSIFANEIIELCTLVSKSIVRSLEKYTNSNENGIFKVVKSLLPHSERVYRDEFFTLELKSVKETSK